MPCKRSSKTLGKAKVVDWKTRLETAVVKKTIAVRRTSAALASAETCVVVAPPELATLGFVCRAVAAARMSSRTCHQ